MGSLSFFVGKVALRRDYEPARLRHHDEIVKISKKKFSRKERGVNALSVYTCKTKANRLRSCSHPSHNRKKPPKGGFAKRLASDFRKAKSAKRTLPSVRKRRLLFGAFSNQLAYGDRLEPSNHPSHERKKPPKGGFVRGWDGWARTSGCRSQSPVPYHLATSHYRTGVL